MPDSRTEAQGMFLTWQKLINIKIFLLYRDFDYIEMFLKKQENQVHLGTCIILVFKTIFQNNVLPVNIKQKPHLINLGQLCSLFLALALKQTLRLAHVQHQAFSEVNKPSKLKQNPSNMFFLITE